MPTRREFLWTTGVTLSRAVAPGPALQAGERTIDAVRLRRRLERLSQFGRPAGGSFADGVSRVAYSEADVAARAWLLEEIRGAGLSPRLDAAGNIFARAGGRASAPPILIGSHIDSVPNGGNFDGDLGTLAALDVLQVVASGGGVTTHPLELVVWAHEESTAFGRGTACSRIVAGDLKAGDLDAVWNGMSRRDALRRIGGDPDRIETAVARPGRWHAYVELHIEQGGTLDAAGIPIGIVEGIVAIHRYDVTIEGVANHAGTTPMDARQDALGEAIRAEAAAIARDTRTSIDMRLASTNPPAPAHAGVMAAIQASAARRDLPARVLPSGAGHDAQMIAALCPMGMIFVPSVGGISHSPREFTRWDDGARGAQVLLDTALALDALDARDSV